MTDKKKYKELNKFEIEKVKEQAASKLGICKKYYDVIGDQIFFILARYARVIYYPLGPKAPWGFTHIIGLKNKVLNDKPFVVINSSISKDCQVFAAAHELYHIWYENDENIIPSTVLDNSYLNKNELLANRFAAEFLMEECLLRQEMEIYSVIKNKITLKDVLKLAKLFEVPYKAMVKRLEEIKFITKEVKEKFLLETDDSLEKYRKLYSVFVEPADNRICIDDLVELACEAYNKNLITFEKLEALLSIKGLSPEDMGIKKPVSIDLPSDDDLEDIMEN